MWISRHHFRTLLRWQQRSFSCNRVVCEKEQFQRDGRQNVNVGTLGGMGHGKTLLSSSLSQISSSLAKGRVEAKLPKDLDNTKVERETGHSQNASHLELLGPKQKRFSLSDLPGNRQYIKNLLAHIFQIDVALLVVCAEEGVTDDTRLHYSIAKHVGVSRVMTFINQRNPCSETAELIKCDLAEFMPDEDLNDVVCGNAAKLSPDVLERLDETKIPDRDPDAPLFWPLEQIGNIPGRGVFAAGRIKAGRLRVGSQPDLFYEGRTTKISVRDLEIFRKVTPELVAGDRGGAFVKLKTDMEVKRGAVVMEKSSYYKCAKCWRVKVEEDLKRVKSNNIVLFHSTLMEGAATLEETIAPKEFILKLTLPIVAKEDDPIVLRAGSEFVFAKFVAIAD